MPVGAAGVGTKVEAAVAVSTLDSAATAFELSLVDGCVCGRGDNASGATALCALIIATKANEVESGDQTIVSGKCTAIASAVIFFCSFPSGEYISKRYSSMTSAIFR